MVKSSVSRGRKAKKVARNKVVKKRKAKIINRITTSNCIYLLVSAQSESTSNIMAIY